MHFPPHGPKLELNRSAKLTLFIFFIITLAVISLTTYSYMELQSAKVLEPKAQKIQKMLKSEEPDYVDPLEDPAAKFPPDDLPEGATVSE